MYTLCSVLFDLVAGTMTVFHGNPKTGGAGRGGAGRAGEIGRGAAGPVGVQGGWRMKLVACWLAGAHMSHGIA